MDNRKVPVSITFQTRDIQPPLFVAGTFSDPQWVPHEMECAAGSDGENIFTQKLEVEPESKLQYKFRVGHGDWWLLNEDSPTGMSRKRSTFRIRIRLTRCNNSHR